MQAILALVLGLLFSFVGLKHHLQLQYMLTFIAGGLFIPAAMNEGTSVTGLPDIITPGNELYWTIGVGLLLCVGVYFYNFWFYRIVSGCAGFGAGAGLIMLVGLAVPKVNPYMFYVGGVGALFGIFFMSSYIQTFVGLVYVIAGGCLVASASSFFMKELGASKSSPLWLQNLFDARGGGVNIKDGPTIGAIAIGTVVALAGFYFSTRSSKKDNDDEDDEENAPLLKKKGRN